MKKIFISFFCLLASCCFANENFEKEMGRGTPVWKYVQTPEDYERIEFFGKLFEKFEKKLEPKEKIPKILHFVWLGPDPFPKNSIHRVKAWIDLHPDWKVLFWTDIDRELPDGRMEKNCIHAPKLLEEEFFHSVNFGEKAKLLAYEILFDEGGVYVDHDSLPHKPLTTLNEALDFYCGLERLGPSIYSSSIRGTSYLMAAKPKHPIMEQTIAWLKENWQSLDESYSSLPKMRILYRTYRALDEGINLGIDKEGNRDVLLPPSYLNTFAAHQHDGTWYRMGTQLETKMHKHLEKTMKSDLQATFMTVVLALVSILGSMALWLFAKRTVK